MGCESGQGYHFALPLEGQAFLAKLRGRKRPAA